MLGLAWFSRPCATAALLLAATAWTNSAHASGSATGNAIIGVFSAPILSGNVISGPGPTLAFTNNGATAVTSGLGTSTLTWGTQDGEPQSAANSSSLTFTGATNLSLNSNTPVQVGAISFTNGGSSIDTLIFGATLSFYFNTVSPGTLLGADTVYINTTTNAFSTPGLTPDQLAADSDYVSICGPSSNLCGKSVESFESAEVNGYGPFRAMLMGVYQGDPSITLTDIVADPASAGDGQIGARPALAVPEPASAALLLAGLIGLVPAVWRPRWNRVAGLASSRITLRG